MLLLLKWGELVADCREATAAMFVDGEVRDRG